MSAKRRTTSREKVARTIEEHQLARRQDRILVAWSGGADSTATAILLGDLGYELVLGHVDHGLRVDSHEDLKHCKSVAGDLRLPFVSRRIKVEPPTEAAAREARYEALEEMRLETRADSVATGHTKDDQAETVVMRLRRGGFPLGIPYRRGRIIRPVLDLRRAETEEVCRKTGVDFLVDPSNYDPQFLRNVVRHSVLAEASDEEFDKLVRSADDARRLIDALDEQLADATAAGDFTASPGRVEIKRQFLADSEPGFRRHIIARALEAVSAEVARALVEDIEKKVITKTGSRLDLKGGHSAWSTKNLLVVGVDPSAIELPPFEVEIPGSARSAEWGFSISVKPSKPEPLDAVWQQVLSGDAISERGRFTVRQWKAGDRFHPLGASGTKKLQDFFVDSSVPKQDRTAVPILEYRGQVVWVVGLRIDDRFKISPETKSAFEISVFPMLRGVDDAHSITAPP